MSEKPLLSISILSSGRIDTIERCLSSLDAIKEQIPCEIIVVDTDESRDNGVRNIVEKYADKVIDFKWCDDFAAARNTGVNAAEGEWFLYLDDDEWFINAQPLLDFILSDEADGYDRITYRIRNYGDEELTIYGDSLGTRGFRLEGGVHFCSKVHEYIEPIEGTVKIIEALVGHTGYIFKSEKDRQEHAKRNIRLLEKMRKEEPGQVRWVMQLMAEYGGLLDYDKELSLADEGLSLMKGARGYQRACIRGLFAANTVRVCREKGDYNGCILRYRQLKKKRSPIGRVAEANIKLDVAQAMYLSGEYKECKEHFRSYLSAYENMHDEPVECAEEYTYFLMNTFRSTKKLLAEVFLICADLKENSTSAYDEYFTKLSWSDAQEDITEELGKALLEGMAGMEYDSRLKEVIRVFWENPKLRRTIQEQIVAFEGKEDNKASYINLIHAVAEEDSLTPEPLDIKIIWDDYNGNRENMKEYFSRLFAATNPLLLDAMLWRIGLRRGAVLDERIREIPIERWIIYVDEFVKKAAYEHVHAMCGIMDNVYLGMPDERYRYFDMNVRLRLI